MKQALRGRSRAIIGLLASGALGSLARSGGLSPWCAKYLGVVLWACGLYWLTRAIVGPTLSRPTAALAALIGSWAVELLQLTPIAHWTSSKHWLLRVALGEVFSLWDLPAYAAGVGLGLALDALLGGGRALPSGGRRAG